MSFLRPQQLQRLARRIHSASPLSARLVDSSTSLTRGPEQLPPSPPRPLRPSQSLAPEVPHATNSLLDEVRFGDSSTRQDLGSIVALDLFLLRALAQLEGGEMDLGSMLKEMRAKEGLVLDSELENESRPGDDRRVCAGVGEEELMREGEQDGIVVVAHVLGGEDPRVSVCSGFKVGETKPGEGDAILTCAHTLQAMAPYIPPPSTKSATFILTSTGHIFPVLSLSSSLPSSDLLLLKLSPTPLRDPSFSASPPRPPSTSPLKPSFQSPTPSSPLRLRHNSPSLWARNLQLSVPSLTFSLAGIFLSPEWSRVRKDGPLQGFTPLVWSVVLNQALGGLLVAMVVRYADSVARGFATSIAIVISTLASVIFFGLVPGPLFIAGATLVIASTILYAMDMD